MKKISSSNITQKRSTSNKTPIKKNNVLLRDKPETGFIDFSKKEKEAREKDWYIFALAFLDLAKNGCEYLIKEKSLKSKKYITIGIIYNLKHSLEIILKAFRRFHRRSQNKELNRSDYSHDTERLFDDNFKKQIEKKLDKKSKKIFSKIIHKYQTFDLFNEYLKGCFKFNDLENTFFKYPENSAKVEVNYSRFLNRITKTDIKNIKEDINEIKKIIDKIKK